MQRNFLATVLSFFLEESLVLSFPLKHSLFSRVRLQSLRECQGRTIFEKKFRQHLIFKSQFSRYTY